MRSRRSSNQATRSSSRIYSAEPPYNEAYALFLENPEHLRVVSGFNFGMLIEVGVAAAASDDLDAAVELALNAGTSGVTAAALPDEDESLADDDLF